MPVWPNTVPRMPVRNSWRCQPGNNVIVSEVDAGPPKYRRRSTAVPEEASFTILMSSAQFVAFDTFWRNDLKGGALAFDFIHPWRGTTVLARIPEPWIQEPDPEKDDRWRVSFPRFLLGVAQ